MAPFFTPDLSLRRKAVELPRAQPVQQPTVTPAPLAPLRRDQFQPSTGVAQPPPTSLLSEDADDSEVNCLDRVADWVRLAPPELLARSQVVLLDDTSPGAEGETGHAVIRQGNRILDPSSRRSYEDLDAYLQENPQYREALSLPAQGAAQLFATAPNSPERAQVLSQLGVAPEQQTQALADNAATNPAQDAEALHEATEGHGLFGWGTDEDAIWETLEGKSPEEIDAIRAAYREQYGHDLDGVLLDETGGEDRERVQSALAAGPYYLNQNLEALRGTPTGEAIANAAEGERVIVLPDDEYERRFPGTGGINSDGTVYVPLSAVDDPGDTSVLQHELVHATVGDALNTGDSLDERVSAAREAFERAGLDPADGERIARATDGWPEDQGVTAQHVATFVLGVDSQREAQGLPPLTPEQRDALVERAARRELALSLSRRQSEDEDYTDAQLVEDYLATPEGQAHPPEGATDAERAESIRQMLHRYESESYPLGALPENDKFGMHDPNAGMGHG